MEAAIIISVLVSLLDNLVSNTPDGRHGYQSVRQSGEDTGTPSSPLARRDTNDSLDDDDERRSLLRQRTAVVDAQDGENVVPYSDDGVVPSVDGISGEDALQLQRLARKLKLKV